MGQIELDGVNTWYDESGTGEPAVLLHGALSDSRTFDGNLTALADQFRLYRPDRRGHGRTPDVEGPISLDLMAQDTIEFLDKVVGGRARLVGQAAGAIVALLVALRRPELVERLVLISGAFHRDGWIRQPSADGPAPAPMVARYAQVSPDGAEHFDVVRAKLAGSAAVEPALLPADLGAAGCRTLVLAGDDDLVSLEHTLALYRGLPDAELAVVPGTSHALVREKPALCLALITDFLTGDAAPTMMPIRRR